ncbi:MAG: DUF4199 domain-containing protein [Flavobacteriales bacterium]
MKDYILNSGLKLGALYVLLTAISYIMGVEFSLNESWSIIKGIVPYAFLIFLVVNYKKMVGGFLNFKDTFTITIGSIAAGAFIGTFFSILLYNFLAPDFAAQLKDASVQKMIMEFEKIPESSSMYEMMESIIEQTEEEDVYSVSNQSLAFFYSLFFHIIISLIIAAFVKKDKPIEISE